MKIRIGFVSNSSSSSFTIWSKKELTTELLMKKLAPGLQEKSIGYGMLSEILNVLVNRAKEMTLNQYIKDQSPEDDEILQITKMISKGFTLYRGYVSDQGSYEGPEYYLCYQDIDFEDGDLVIHHSGGY